MKISNNKDHKQSKIIPVILSKGVKLFHDKRPTTNLKPITTKTFESGLVQLHYTVA